MNKKLTEFFSKKIWDDDITAMPRWQAVIIKQIRLVTVAASGFKYDNGMLRATALTFFIMLSVVPVVAMLFAIARGFGLEESLHQQLFKALAGHEDVAERIMAFADNMLAKAKSGVIAGVGVVVLLWSVMQVLGNIEESFNAVWKVKKGRSWVRKFTDYFAIMLTTPILLIVASGMTVFVVSQVEKISQQISLLGYVTPFIFFMLKFLPYVLHWILFMLIYMIMPNTKVKPGVALISGIIFGTIFQGVEWAYVNFQVGVSSYNAIYGSFAALPLFLVWVQTSWVIVLFGSEYCYAYHHFDPYARRDDGSPMSHSERQTIALAIAHRVVTGFMEGKPPLTVEKICMELKIRRSVVLDITDELVAGGMLAKCLDESSSGSPSRFAEYGFVPARSPEKITAEDVLTAMNTCGRKPIYSINDMLHKKLEGVLGKIQSSIHASEGNKLLKDL